MTDYVSTQAFPSLSTASISYNFTNGTIITGVANATYLNTTATEQLGEQGTYHVVEFRLNTVEIGPKLIMHPTTIIGVATIFAPPPPPQANRWISNFRIFVYNMLIN